MEPSTDDDAITDTCNVVLEKLEHEQQAVYCVNEPETINSGRLMNVGHASLCDLVKAEVERQVADLV